MCVCVCFLKNCRPKAGLLFIPLLLVQAFVSWLVKAWDSLQVQALFIVEDAAFVNRQASSVCMCLKKLPAEGRSAVRSFVASPGFRFVVRLGLGFVAIFGFVSVRY